MNCPVCKDGSFAEKATKYECIKCNFFIPKVIARRHLETEEMYALVAHGRTDLLDGFVSKANKLFSAHLKISNKKVVFDFPYDKTTVNKLTITIHSMANGEVRIDTIGPYIAHLNVSYGHVPERHAQCLALLTVLSMMEHRGLLEKFMLEIQLGSIEAAYYVLKERKPRDKALNMLLEIIWGKLSKSKEWKLSYHKLARKFKVSGGNPQTAEFPKSIFYGMEVQIEKKPGFLVATFPSNRPDIYAQFEASISTAKRVAEEVGKYYVQTFAEKRFYAWLLATRGVIG